MIEMPQLIHNSIASVGNVQECPRQSEYQYPSEESIQSQRILPQHKLHAFVNFQLVTQQYTFRRMPVERHRINSSIHDRITRNSRPQLLQEKDERIDRKHQMNGREHGQELQKFDDIFRCVIIAVYSRNPRMHDHVL